MVDGRNQTTRNVKLYLQILKNGWSISWFRLRLNRISSQSSHNARHFRENESGIETHSEVEKQWCHVPDAIKERVLRKKFFRCCVLEIKYV